MALPDYTTQDPATYKANIDSTASDHDTKLGTLLPTVEADHTRATSLHLLTSLGLTTDPKFDVEANLTETTWESIGPTGSGADNIWTALDLVPSTAKFLLIKLDLYVQSDASSGGARINSAFCKEGITPVIDSHNLIVTDWMNNSATGTKEIPMVVIPCDSNQVFQFYYTVLFEIAYNYDLTYLGYMN